MGDRVGGYWSFLGLLYICGQFSLFLATTRARFSHIFIYIRAFLCMNLSIPSFQRSCSFILACLHDVRTYPWGVEIKLRKVVKWVDFNFPRRSCYMTPIKILWKFLQLRRDCLKAVFLRSATRLHISWSLCNKACMKCDKCTRIVKAWSYKIIFGSVLSVFSWVEILIGIVYRCMSLRHWWNWPWEMPNSMDWQQNACVYCETLIGQEAEVTAELKVQLFIVYILRL